MSLYDIFIIGQGPRNTAAELTDVLKQCLTDLGVPPNRNARFLTTKDISKRNPLLPSVAACLLPLTTTDEEVAVTQLVHLGVPVIPLIERLKDFSKQAPDVLKKFNAMEVHSGGKGLVAARDRRRAVTSRMSSAAEVAPRLGAAVGLNYPFGGSTPMKRWLSLT